MPDYQFYFIKKPGHVVREPLQFNLPSDGAAVEEAKRLRNGQVIKIRQGARNVAQVGPDGEEAA